KSAILRAWRRPFSFTLDLRFVFADNWIIAL
ncbi:MAG: hypothetical protein ACI87E_003731, partial [Mariniblastus sp.]